MSALDEGEVHAKFVNHKFDHSDTQVLTLSSYEDDTVIFVGENRDDLKVFSLSKEQLEELYAACGKALALRKEVLDDEYAHFTNKEVREYMERE